MFKKEISPAEMRELNSKSFKNTQKIFRRRLREIAAGGENKAKYKEEDYCAGECVKGWLRSLGFTCREVGCSGWVEITWPETEAPDKKKVWHTMTKMCLEEGKDGT